MDTVPVSVTVNGDAYSAEVEPRLLLVHFIRENLGLTGTHIGCDTTSCGACTILFDGKPIKSCTMFAVQADGHDLQTVEGLANGPTLHPIQEGFFQEHGLQCGFCTPGMMMTAVGAAGEEPGPLRARNSRGDLRESLPLHGLRQHRSLGAARGKDACARTAAEPELVAAGQGGYADGSANDPGRAWRLRSKRQAQGRSAVSARQGQLHRRHQAARHALHGHHP